ncbi:uncharacterized protein LOC142557722 [Dermacentor variabilis]|uniref:uncharacterized protein LOC142557722 n=1 Tax=Dermacentor variabilis TaxID=34621 RepID=UPI003F5B12E4
MKAYVVLALVICGHICQIQAATLSKPEKTAHAFEKLLEEELTQSIAANERGDLVEALKALKSSANGEETEEGYFLHLIAIGVRAIVHAVRAGVQAGRAAVSAAVPAAVGGAVGGFVGSAGADKIRNA